MNLELKEQIKNKAFKTKNIEKGIWNEKSFRDIELHLLSFFNYVDELDEEEVKTFIQQLNFETDKAEYIKESYELLYSNYKELIDEIVLCGTVDEYINTILDGYGMVLDNDVIAWVDIM